MQVNVNGKTFTVPDGSSVNIVNNVVMINGQPYEGPGYDDKHFKTHCVRTKTRSQ